MYGTLWQDSSKDARDIYILCEEKGRKTYCDKLNTVLEYIPFDEDGSPGTYALPDT